MKYSVAAALMVATLYGAGATGQALDYSGTYTVVGARDEQIRLSLLQTLNGAVSGTLSGSGTSFEVQGETDRDVLTGTVFMDHERLNFEALLDGPELYVFFGRSSGGGYGFLGPELVFTRELSDPYDYGTRPRPGRDPLETRDPLGTGNPLSPYAGAGALSFAGTFTDGHVTLEVRGGGRSLTGFLAIDGREYSITARETEGVLVGRFLNGTEEYAFTGTRDGLGIILESGGDSYYLYRVEDFGPDRRRFPNTVTDPGRGTLPYRAGPYTASDWTRIFQDSALRFSSRSRATILDLCHNRTFLFQDGGRRARRGSGPDGDGAWEIVIRGGLATIELRFWSGETAFFELLVRGRDILIDGHTAVLEPSRLCRY